MTNQENQEITTEREAVEAMAILGNEHLEAVAALGADIKKVYYTGDIQEELRA